VYLHRPAALKHLKFKEFDEQYIVMSGALDSYEAPDIYFIDMRMPLKRGVYIKKRSYLSGNRSITRVETVPYSCGEPFFLRLIVVNRPVSSFVDAKTHNGHTYSTYQECAIAAGIVKQG
jgi:hypothetical protein